MQVLASADVHGRQSVYEWLIKVTREHQVEALVLAGDLLGCRDGFDTPEDSQRHEARIPRLKLACEAAREALEHPQ